jgi:hypothetical protein
MKTDCADLTADATARLPVSDLGNGNERKSWTAAGCLIHQESYSAKSKLDSIFCRLRLAVAHFGWLATDAFGFCDQPTHFPEQRSSAVQVIRGL